MPTVPPLPSLPIDAVLPQIRAALAASTRLVVEAPPGAGKTTRVPPALLDEAWLEKRRIVMLEPRRLAAKSAARHMAALLGEEAGRRIGYRTALEGRESAATRILVVTEGILTRMIQSDPALEGVGCVIFDEAHERSLHADLGLALCLESQEALRPDLRLIVMSATLDGGRMAAFLGGCPRVEARGRSFPVAVRYRPPSRPGTPCEELAAQAVQEALREESGSILVFLPGAGEIRRTAERLLPALPPGTALRPLYGDLSPEEQDAAVAPARHGGRKVVLATNIAESSLTIEGVRVVVDSGLARTLRFEPAWGMSRLVTERISRASADQRCGRAGRLEQGLCLRLWPEREQAALRPEATPEILEADLASLCLEVAVWGLRVDEVPASLRWLDAPPGIAWEQARQLLRALGALDREDRATKRGRMMANLPLHPRLAHMVLEGKEQGRGPQACALAALFAERDPLRGGAGADLSSRLAFILDRPGSGAERGGNVGRIREQMRRIALRAGIDLKAGASSGTLDPGPLLALAWPERVALRRGPGGYLMRNGRGAVLHPDDPLGAHACLAIAEAQGGERLADARIRLAAPLSRQDLENLFAEEIILEERIAWDEARQAVSARRLRRLDALVLEETPLPDPDPEQVRAVLLEALSGLGAQVLPWTEEQQRLRGRIAFARGLEERGLTPALGWPDCSDAALSATLPDWLGPFLGDADRLGRVTPAMLGAALAALLPWPLPAKLDELAPEALDVPSGRRIPLEYGAAGQVAQAPVLAVKLQELFGLTATPSVAGGRVPVTLHLLSPAGRPVQVTSDLAGFWQNGYPAVRAELRGRYPKHPWPEDPLTAPPTRRTKRELHRAG